MPEPTTQTTEPVLEPKTDPTPEPAAEKTYTQKDIDSMSGLEMKIYKIPCPFLREMVPMLLAISLCSVAVSVMITSLVLFLGLKRALV